MNRPLRSHIYMPAQTWWTPYTIMTWDGTYRRYNGLAYEPIEDTMTYKPRHVPIPVPLELVAA